MRSEEVNTIINNICDKLGIAANNLKELVPSLVKMKVIGNILLFVSCIAILIVIGIVINKLLKARGNADRFDKGDYTFGIIALCVVMFICFCVCMGALSDTIKWIVSPEAMAIEYILGFLSK